MANVGALLSFSISHIIRHENSWDCTSFGAEGKWDGLFEKRQKEVSCPVGRR